MSEIPHTQPHEAELPKWDRSAEGVHRAVGRIADMLYDRGQRITKGGYGIIYNGYNDTESQALSITEKNDGVAYNEDLTSDDINTARQNIIEIERRSNGVNDNQLRVTTTPSGVEALFHKGGLESNKDKERGASVIITNPAAVGQIAANSLNKIRANVAQAEIDATQDVIGFVNGKK